MKQFWLSIGLMLSVGSAWGTDAPVKVVEAVTNLHTEVESGNFKNVLTYRSIIDNFLSSQGMTEHDLLIDRFESLRKIYDLIPSKTSPEAEAILAAVEKTHAQFKASLGKDDADSASTLSLSEDKTDDTSEARPASAPASIAVAPLGAFRPVSA